MSKRGIAFLICLMIEAVALYVGETISPWMALFCQIPAGIAWLLSLTLEG